MPDGPNKPDNKPNWVPVPDPTLLTTQQLVREIASLKEIVFTRLDGMDEAIKIFNANITRVLTDTDKQIQHLQALHDSRFENVDKQFKERDTRTQQSATAHDKAIDAALTAAKESRDAAIDRVTHLEALHDEKFKGIETQFKERDVRTEQTSRDAKTAVDAALQAAKEAVGKANDSFTLATAKSEANFTKQIDQLSQLINANQKALDDKVADLKERFSENQGVGVGQVSAHSTQATSNTLVVSIIAVILSAGALIILAVKSFG